LSFSTNGHNDSVAAKNIYAAVSRVLVQTKRFTVLELDKWKLTQEEMERQKDAAFINQDIIAKGKSLGAQVLIAGFVKNAELYNDGGTTNARVDYELKYIDVETGKSIAAQTFTGNSETFANKSDKVSRAVGRLLPGLGDMGSKLASVTEVDKNSSTGKIIKAIDESAERVNSWVRNTFGFNLLFMKVVDEDKGWC
jgi:hypothetical protein